LPVQFASRISTESCLEFYFPHRPPTHLLSATSVKVLTHAFAQEATGGTLIYWSCSVLQVLRGFAGAAAALCFYLNHHS